jgi:hypothetical protein
MAVDSAARNPSAEQRATIARTDFGVHAASNMAQLEVSAAAAEPVWPSPSAGFLREWERFARYPNYLVAMIVACLLETEGVPTVVESIGPFPGTSSSAIWVPRELVHRARWILA